MTSQSKKSPDPLALPFLSSDDIRAHTFVRHVEIHDTLDSTNNRAAELARNSEIELPALIVARHQTAGRGRGTNKWWSADGGLTFSLLIDPAAHGIDTANWPQLSLATAVAVCDSIQFEAPQAVIGIKWPNDVFADGGKISGILIESPGGVGPANERLIIGVGVNVSKSWRDAPRDAGIGGIALCDITTREHDLQTVLIGALKALGMRIAQLRAHDAELPYAWQRLNLLAGKSVLVENGSRRIKGECREIALDGALVIDDVLGKHRVYSGSVRID